MVRSLFIFALAAANMLGHAADFSLSSADVANGAPLKLAQVYKGYGCQGGNIAPALAWTDEPAGTRSFAITLFDPDAPNGGRGWWHWLLLNIPSSTHTLAKGSGQAGSAALPAGARQLNNDFGSMGYGGACPPIGNAPHRYLFTVWALKTASIDLPVTASGAMVQKVLEQQSLAKASITARYGR
jgi:Raf kinase inhibitor-like YbhB/YbcL family protein